jgi:glucose 1-dehydrogenase
MATAAAFDARIPLRGLKALITGAIPWAGHVNHAAPKGGVMLMMKGLAQEVAEKRIRINAIAPGAIKTAINRAAWDSPEAERRLLELIPYGRIGEAADIAEAAVWLASDQSDHVTGTTLVVDGGMTLYPAFGRGGWRLDHVRSMHGRPD